MSSHLYNCSVHALGRFKSPIGSNRKLPPLQGRQAPSLGPLYEWVDVGMLEYDQDKKLYLVKRVFVPNKIIDQKSNETLNRGDTSNGESDGRSDSCGSDSDGSEPNLNKTSCKVVESADGIHYWVPRVRLMFVAEDPKVFAERVSNAYYLRENTEALLRYMCMTYTIHVHVCV